MVSDPRKKLVEKHNRSWVATSIQELNISCQDVLLQKDFDLNNKPKSPIRCVCYGLKCCMEAGVSKITLSGSNLLLELAVEVKSNVQGVNSC